MVGKDYMLIRPKSLKNILKIFEKLVVRSKAYMEKNNQKWFDTKIILRIHVGEEIELSLLAPITTPTKCLLYPFYIAADNVVYLRAKTAYQPLQLDMLIESDSVRLNYAVKKFNEANRFTKYYLLKIPKTTSEAKKNIIGLLKDTLEETLGMILMKGDEYNMENMKERGDGKYIYLKKDTKDCVYTVGDLKQFLNEAKVPDDAKLTMHYEDFVHGGIGSLCYAKNENELTISDE